MPDRLSGKVTVITGAAGGQGQTAACIFAREGSRLVLSDVDAAGLEQVAEAVRQTGGEAVTLAGDLTDEEVNGRLVDLAIDRYGRLDVMYNNAGRARFVSIHETTLQDWNFNLANELTLVFLGCKHALGAMLKARSGCIINVASAAGLYGVPGHGSHAATKAGVIGLTRQIAVEYAPQGIRCNAIAPAYIDHPQVRRAYPGQVPPVADYPLGRLGRAEDAVYCALYLASDEASFVTGQVFIVDGGKTAR